MKINIKSLSCCFSMLMFLQVLCINVCSSASISHDILDLLPGILSGAKNTTVNFNVTLPSVKTNEYVIELARWDIPNNGTDPVKTTNNLQRAIDWAASQDFGIIKVPAGYYLIGKYGNGIYQAGIEIPSNTAFVMESGTLIEMAGNDKWNYCVIAVTEQKNVIIRGGTIKGDRDTHTYTPRPSDGATAHDEGHAICIQNESQYVLVEDVNIQNANGDGILLVGQKGPGTSVKDITIRNNNFYNNRRQGISIVGADRVRIGGNEIHHTGGTSPQFGIDIESGIYTSRNIQIIDNYFHHNRGGDIVNTDGRNVFIDKNVMEQGAGSKYIDGPIVYWKNADQTIRYNSIQMTDGSVNGKSGIIAYSNSRPKVNPALTYIHDNVCHGCGMYMYSSADVDIRQNELKDGYIVLQNFDNLTLINNKVTHSSKCWAYRFRNVTGRASGNTYNGEPFPIPLSSTPWTGCWVN